MTGVRIVDLVKVFGEVVAVDHVSLEVRDGEFVTLLGPSGCGKTTTLRCVAGLEVPTSGEIYLGDRLVSSPAKGVHVPPERRNMGMVFQSYAVWPHMTVFDNVAYPLKLKKLPREEMRERVNRILELVKLSGLEKRYPHQLSGGQQKRVALARALVMEPEVLLLDEPLSNLDAKLREEMRFELKDLQRKLGVTILYVTHDQAEAMAMSDRIAVMDRGRLRQVGTPVEIYRRPVDSFVAGFIGLANFLKFDGVELREGRALVRLFGEVTLECAPPLRRDGGELLLVVRPSDIEMLRERQPNTVEGVVTRVSFLGDVVDYRVRVGDQEVRVQASPAVIHEAGSRVFLKIKTGILVRA